MHQNMDGSAFLGALEWHGRMFSGKYWLQDILFSGLGIKHCMLAFGLVITNSISNSRQVEKYIYYTNKWHVQSPIWCSRYILSRNRPFVFEKRGIHTLEDIFGANDLMTFHKLWSCRNDAYRTEPSPLFLYLHFRSAMNNPLCGTTYY